MGNSNSTVITVKATINSPVAYVWECWTKPEHITKWCFATDDWHAPYAENDLRVDGKFKTGMAAKDGSFAFDFEGVYTAVEDLKLIAYALGDSRQVKITFTENDGKTDIVETFDAETQNPVEMQQNGWQAILDNFKKYTEAV